MVDVVRDPVRIDLKIKDQAVHVHRYVPESGTKDHLDSGYIQLGKGLFVYTTLDKALAICGLNSQKIDYAIPQQYFDDYLKMFGEPPKLMWDYNTNFFGYPLFRDEVIERFKSIVKIELMAQYGSV